MVNVIIVMISLFLWRVFTINKMLDKFKEITDSEWSSSSEFWKMVFSLKKPIIENFISASNYYKLTGGLSDVFILRILKKAKKTYIKDIKSGNDCGLCVKIIDALCSQGFDDSSIIPNLDSYIPGFNADFLGGNDDNMYWWPISDTKSRIAALNKLIKLYS